MWLVEVTAGTHGCQILRYIKIHLLKTGGLLQPLERAMTYAADGSTDMTLFVDLIVRIQSHICLCIMALVTEAAAGIIRSATEKLWIEFTLNLATHALFG